MKGDALKIGDFAILSLARLQFSSEQVVRQRTLTRYFGNPLQEIPFGPPSGEVYSVSDIGHAKKAQIFCKCTDQ